MWMPRSEKLSTSRRPIDCPAPHTEQTHQPTRTPLKIRRRLQLRILSIGKYLALDVPGSEVTIAEVEVHETVAHCCDKHPTEAQDGKSKRVSPHPTAPTKVLG
jgi:hypothetical protein